ncbi:MAG: glycoside hydrolase family 95-like protein, partial [Bacteroidota bacterium]
NIYITPEGYHGATLYGSTSDLALCRETFLNTITAAEILNTDRTFIKELQEIHANLHPYQISKKGGYLQEWYHDWEDEDPKHRHQSHLFGLYPGHHLSPETTPKITEAVKQTLNVKGDKSTGWSQGWKINLWARLKDGNRAYQLYRELLKYREPTGFSFDFSKGGGTYPNLFDAHPPFQIDGNFGGAAGVLEMLIHSSESDIHILPACPDVWDHGMLYGVKARGGFELRFRWYDGEVTALSIYSDHGGDTVVHYNNRRVEVHLDAGQTLDIL